MASAMAASIPIRWFDGTPDPSGAPEGLLLTPNQRWFGDRLFTGVEYEWETSPEAPSDTREAKGKPVPAHRLFRRHPADADTQVVGRHDAAPLVVSFDFKRPCKFSEVTLLHAQCHQAGGFVEFSEDRANWHDRIAFSTTGAITRLRCRGTGHFLRLSFQALPPASRTILDDVYVWGDGEVSSRYPEAIDGIASDGALEFPGGERGAVSILPMPTPSLNSKPSGTTPANFPLTMALNETESRYFAVVNGTDAPQSIGLSADGFGDGVAAELLVGGAMRISPPRRRITALERVKLATENAFGINNGDRDEIDLVPFFFTNAIPRENFLRRYLANPSQVAGFPCAVPLGPGEGCVVMLRLTTSGAAPGLRDGALRAVAASATHPAASASAALPIPLTIVDLSLPQQSMWIYAYEPFTKQYPFESERRVARDAERYIGIGATTTRFLPEPGSKEAIFFSSVPQASVGCDKWCDPELYKRVAKGEFAALSENDRLRIQDGARAFLARSRLLGLESSRVAAFLPDEPQPGNARSVMALARLVKDAVPDLRLHCDPLFYAGRGKGDGNSPFYSPETVAGALLPEYNDCIDISCPHSYLATPRPDHVDDRYGESASEDGLPSTASALMEWIWLYPRPINAMYCHPAGRTGREMVWRCRRFGFNGFAYYEYCHPNIDVWDIDSWGVLNLDYQAVMPLGEDVAITALYETLREASEDARLIDALKAAGREDVLADVMKRSNAAWDRTGWHWRHRRVQTQKGEDILALRETALRAFDSVGR